jgi:hypothetical protein
LADDNFVLYPNLTRIDVIALRDVECHLDVISFPF